MFQPGPEDDEVPVNDERSRKLASPDPAESSVDGSDRRLRQLQKVCVTNVLLFATSKLTEHCYAADQAVPATVRV